MGLGIAKLTKKEQQEEKDYISGKGQGSKRKKGKTSSIGTTDKAKNLKSKVSKRAQKRFIEAGGKGDVETDARAFTKPSQKVLRGYDKDMGLVDTLGTQAQRAKSFQTPSRTPNWESPVAVTTEQVKVPGPGRKKNPVTGKMEPLYQSKTTRKKLAKGGTVRMASGGPVVDSYDYS